MYLRFIIGVEDIMDIKITKHINKVENNRVEFLFVNFDFFDGNDLIAKILCNKYGMIVGEKIDGMFYSIIPLNDKNKEYKLVWHEDVGNYFYSEDQDEKTLERILGVVESLEQELNSKFGQKSKN